MKSSLLFLTILCLLLCVTPTNAGICSVDPVPAATLLLPYFEVDPTSASGVTTLFEIVNTSSNDVLTKVTVWSDLSVPVFSFNVFLMRGDVAPINVRDVLNLRLPPFPPGPLPPGCPLPPFPPLLPTDIRAALTGQPVPGAGNRCFGINHNSPIARGFVTIDVVDQCASQFVGDPGYAVAGGQGTLQNDNVLTGNFLYVEPANDFAQGESLVHIEADGVNPQTATPGEYTFYGRYVAWTATDNREPLSRELSASYLLNPIFTGGTDLIVWRDPKEVIGSFPCGSLPPPFPLGQQAVEVFDQMATSFTLSPGIVSFPWATQRVPVGGPNLPVPFNAGWLRLDLDIGTGSPPSNPNASQNWVGVVESALGRFSTGFSAAQLLSACQ